MCETYDGVMCPDFNPEYHDRTGLFALRSAGHVVPLVLEYIELNSVIDIGCGLGAWLSEFRRRGVRDVLGFDGDYIDRSFLAVSQDRFRALDLAQPFNLDETADLAISLEVAQHLPATSAQSFIRSLTEIAPVVLFSSAAPAQGGVHHINEQWPDYWAERFDACGFAAVDCVRDRIWNNENVAWWYAQNIMFFLDRERLSECPALTEAGITSFIRQLVHPRSSRAIWETDRDETRKALLRITGPGTVIIVDDGKLALDLGPTRPIRQLLERDGTYWGSPQDDATAIGEIERLRSEGARYIAFTFSAAWWLDHYASAASWLRREFKCISDTPVTVFDLTAKVTPNHREP